MKIFNLILLLLLCNTLFAEKWNRIIDLRGYWYFDIGDNLAWAEPATKLAGWEKIFVPSAWENEGFPGYDGYAWYQKEFLIPPELRGRTLYLHLGYVDDVELTFFNGNIIGTTGYFPPDFETAYNKYRTYLIPEQYINFYGKNIVSVRVFDKHLEGGIISGNVGIFERADALKPDISLAGLWKFKTGDNEDWKNRQFDDSHWSDLIVPLFWDTQGYREYDGFAWYRTYFTIPEKYKNERLILLLGKIDDLDEAYLNEHRIGRTGRFPLIGNIPVSDEYRQLRAYTIPGKYLQPDGINLLAVRVYDGMIDGGIYEGPVGIITRDRYLKWEKSQKKKGKSIFDILFGD